MCCQIDIIFPIFILVWHVTVFIHCTLKAETKWDSFSVSANFANFGFVTFIQPHDGTSNHCQVERSKKVGFVFIPGLNLNLARELPWQQNPSTLLEFCLPPKAFKETFICRQHWNNLRNNKMHLFAQRWTQQGRLETWVPYTWIALSCAELCWVALRSRDTAILILSDCFDTVALGCVKSGLPWTHIGAW